MGVEFSLSIITVTKNCAATIARTLESIAAIKNLRIECVIVDGVSTDGTVPIIEAKTDLVDIFLSEPDTGIYNAMNKGVQLSSGKFLLFLNGDDVLIKKNFDDAFVALVNNDCDIFCAQTRLTKIEHGNIFLSARPKLLPFFNSVPHPSSFIKRQLLMQTPYREDLRIASDYHFFLRAFLNNNTFVTYDAATAIHDRGGTSSDTDLSSKEVEAVRRELLGLSYYLYQGLRVLYKIVQSPIINKVRQRFG